MQFYFWETSICVKRMNLSKLTIKVDFWHLNWHLYWPEKLIFDISTDTSIDLIKGLTKIVYSLVPTHNYNLKVKMKL